MTRTIDCSEAAIEMSQGNITSDSPLSNNQFDLVRSSEIQGFRNRRTPNGPEAQLVESFLSALPISQQKGCHTTVFQEPKLQSGFPDIVAVSWQKSTTLKWNKERAFLSNEDVRVAHLLTVHGPQSEERLEYFFQRRIWDHLEKLSNMGIVSKRNGVWHASALRKNFAVRRIISFEAKMAKWAKAIEQASLNRWFASESYVLLPRIPKTRRPFNEALKAGVGIWVAGELRPTLKPSSDSAPQPVSYASWLFNEWAWRCAMEKSSTVQELSK